MKIDIVVLNYNGEKIIPECMPSIIKAKNNSRHGVKIHVIDNESTDSSLRILQQWANEINILRHKNKFLCSFNDVVGNLDSDVVILLNNDIKVDGQFIDTLADVFIKHDDVFLAAPKVLTFDGKEENAATKARIKFGLFWAAALPDKEKNDPDAFTYTFSSGFGAFDRRKFLELGGYDEMYLPGRFEDVDLSLRAWKMGWFSYYEPKSIVYHMGQSAFKERFGKKGIDKIDGRNIFLFMWKNYDKALLAVHIFFLPAWFLRWALKGSFHYIGGFFEGLSRIKVILEKRRVEKGIPYRLSTKEVFYKNQPWA